MSRTPPPRATSRGCRLLARLMTSSLRWSNRRRAWSAWGTSTIWIWPIRIGSVLEVSNPPAWRASLAAKLTAATMDGSSTTMGTT